MVVSSWMGWGQHLRPTKIQGHASPVFHRVVCSYRIRIQNGWSALLIAAEHGHSEMVELLLQHKASIDFQDRVMHGDMCWSLRFLDSLGLGRVNEGRV